jgi:hypothetical protein
MKREWRRVGAASARVSAGALVFLASGTGAASAQTQGLLGSGSGSDCKLGVLGELVCGLLGVGGGTTTAPPKAPSGGGSTSAPKPKPQPKPKPKPKAAPAHHPGSAHAQHPVAPPDIPGAPVPPQIAAPQQSGPALPDIVPQDPLVVPQPVPPAPTSQARLASATDPLPEPMPPLLIATASGIIGAVAALNISILRQGRRRHR